MEKSTTNLHTKIVSSYDGSCIKIDLKPAFSVGNYLGGGIASVVYEGYSYEMGVPVAVKILNPIGYKFASKSVLDGCVVLLKGMDYDKHLCIENVSWLFHPLLNKIIAAVQRPDMEMTELSLCQCAELWGYTENSWSSAEEDPVMDTKNEMHARVRVVPFGNKLVRVPWLPPKYALFLKHRKMVYREIAHMQKLTGRLEQTSAGHPNVLQLYDVLELMESSKSTIFLVLELASGGELFDRIKDNRGVEEPMAREYFKQLLSGVKYCHQLGIVHRDLKPENLLLSDNESGGILKIADFGFSAHDIAAASAQDHENLNQTSSFRRLKSVVGSPHYVAPEILSSDRFGYDGRKADMWSLGVVLYSMLAGSLPFGKDLQNCARYQKFAVWANALPVDRHTGKLVLYPMEIEKSNDNAGFSNKKYPSWFFTKSIHESARMLIVALLHPNPVCRFSCDEAEIFEWISDSDPVHR